MTIDDQRLTVWSELGVMAEYDAELRRAIAAYKDGNASEAQRQTIADEIVHQSDCDWAESCKRAINLISHELVGLEEVSAGTVQSGRCPKCTINGREYWAIL